MVLQSGGEGQQGSRVWGYGTYYDPNDPNGSDVMFRCLTTQGNTFQGGYSIGQISANIWEIVFSPNDPGDLCQLQVIIDEM